MHRDPRVRDILVRTWVQYRRLSERKTLLCKKKSRSQRGVKKDCGGSDGGSGNGGNWVVVATVMMAIIQENGILDERKAISKKVLVSQQNFANKSRPQFPVATITTWALVP